MIRDYKKAFQFLSIRMLLIFLMTLVIIPTIIIFFSLYIDLQKSINAQLQEESLKTTTLIGNKLSQNMDNMIQASSILVSDPQIISLLSGKQPVLPTQSSLSLLLDQKFNLLRTSLLGGYNCHIEVFDGFGRSYVSQLNWTLGHNEWRNTDWFQEALQQESIPVFTYHKDISGDYFLILARRFWHYGNVPSNSVAVIYMLEDGFYKHRVSPELAKDDTIFIIDKEGNIVSHSDKTMLGRNLNDDPAIQTILKSGSAALFDNKSNTRVIITGAPIKYTDWFVVRISDYAALSEEFSLSLRDNLILMSVFLIFSVMMISAIVFGITKPVTELSNIMCTVKESGFKYTRIVPSYRCREAHDLGESFNTMIEYIDRLMEDIRQKQQKESELMISILQAQINPHFLFNTLNTIRWMAIVSKCGNVANMVENLGTILEISINDSNKMIPLEKEIEITKCYIAIQRARYNQWENDHFIVNVSVSRCLVPKLILQPILENCFKHGLSKVMPADICISINAFLQESDVIIEIADNGIGIEPDILPGLLDESMKTPRSGGKSESVGLKNVNQRIKLIFGNEYGLEITSEPGVRTTVRIKMPVVVDDQSMDFHSIEGE
jgi:two-component system sensor histidine kinase YesM